MLNNWTPNHDPRNRDFGIAPALPGFTPRSGYHTWPVAPAMNQGEDGACVGYAVATAAGRPEQAERVYGIAKTLDQFPGEAYSGTSVTAGAKAAKALELITEYRWAFGVDQAVDALVNVGPVVLGLYWTEGMRDLTNGELMTHSGRPIGGHCTLAVGYIPKLPLLDGAPAIVIQNSWGPGWGLNGRALLSVSDLTTLLQRQGEACVVTPA